MKVVGLRLSASKKASIIILNMDGESAIYLLAIIRMPRF